MVSGAESNIVHQHSQAIAIWITSLELMDELGLVNKTIPWNEFSRIIDTIEANSQYYSDTASKQVGLSDVWKVRKSR